jgi:ribonuclease P protein component
MAQRYTFVKSQRLHLQRDFAGVFAKKSTAGDALLVVYVDHNGLRQSRLGIRVSKRLGDAVTRNRCKRMIREAFRLWQHDLPGGLDVICVARKAHDLEWDAIRGSLKRLMVTAEARLKRRSAPRH